jgi:hypothetical protein
MARRRLVAAAPAAHQQRPDLIVARRATSNSLSVSGKVGSSTQSSYVSLQNDRRSF